MRLPAAATAAHEQRRSAAEQSKRRRCAPGPASCGIFFLAFALELIAAGLPAASHRGSHARPPRAKPATRAEGPRFEANHSGIPPTPPAGKSFGAPGALAAAMEAGGAAEEETLPQVRRRVVNPALSVRVTRHAAQAVIDQLEADAAQNWDKFYKLNADRFFKDRRAWRRLPPPRRKTALATRRGVSGACRRAWRCMLRPPLAARCGAGTTWTWSSSSCARQARGYLCGAAAARSRG